MLVFVHINKTAGSTVRYMLRSSFGPRHCDVEPWHAPHEDPPFSAEDLARVRRAYPALDSIAGHRIAAHVDLGEPATDLTYFTFLRDPVRTTASRFQYHVDHRGKDVVFEEWIQRDWLRDAQCQRIAGVADADEAIRVIERKDVFVGLAERFDESMVMLRDLRAPQLDISYERVNVAKRNTIAAALLSDPRSLALLTEANEQDLLLYRYASQQRYPRLQATYGDSLDARVAQYRSEQSSGFNRRNLALFGLKQRAVHRPLVALYRRRLTRPIVERALS